MQAEIDGATLFTDRRAGSLRSKRVRQPWPAGQPFKILSLDGGGIKGIFTAEFLRCCEAEFCNGTTIGEHFDLIAGTSTGGIIAVGLGIGMTAGELVSFYIEDGRRIFPKRNWLQKILHFLVPLYSYQELERALKLRFGERLFGESDARLLIPAFMVPRTEIAVFKTDHHPDYLRDHEAKAWEVARATSAAPTFLSGLEDKASGKIFIDGGIWANNPTMLAIVEALTAYEVSLEQIEVLSIGTGNRPLEISPLAARGGLLSWKSVIEAAMFLTTDNVKAQASLLLGPGRYVRIEPPGALCSIDLGDYARAREVLPTAGQAEFTKNQNILSQFMRTTARHRERYFSIRPQYKTDAR